MPPPKSKKRGLFRRFVSFLGDRSNESAVERHQDSDEIPGTGPSRSAHPSTHSIPDLSLPVDNSTPESLVSQPAIRQTRSENRPSQDAAISTHTYQDFLQPPRPQPFPAQQPYDNPVAPESGSAYGGTSFLAGASGFRMRDVQYNHQQVNQVTVNTGGGSGDGSIDGASATLGGWTHVSLNPTTLLRQAGSFY